MDYSEERILACLDRALDILGPSVKYVIYFYLLKKEGVGPRDLIENPKRFLQALHNFFGNGADVMEYWINRELRKEAGLCIEESRNLLEAIANARLRLAERLQS